jgi:purine nucleoside phosphorylase
LSAKTFDDRVIPYTKFEEIPQPSVPGHAGRFVLGKMGKTRANLFAQGRVEQSRLRFQRAAKKIGMKLHEGVYAGLLGPQYETPAEVRMLRSLGADAIGMSTVLEAIQARALELEVVGFSCLTNWAAGIGTEN